MKLVGVDLSTQPRRTGICVLDNGGVRVGLCEGPASTHIETMLGYCEDARVVAIDVPFGWPKPFVETMKWYEVGTPLDHLREEYRLRKTDLWIRKNVPPLNPLSVSTDKLGSTTIVGTNLLYAFGSRGFELSPRTSRTYPAVIEVYPAASLTIWGLHSGERGTMLEEPRERFRLQLTDQTQSLLLGTAHCFDALVCALTAKAYMAGCTVDPPECVSDILDIEGWIRVPNGPR